MVAKYDRIHQHLSYWKVKISEDREYVRLCVCRCCHYCYYVVIVIIVIIIC